MPNVNGGSSQKCANPPGRDCGTSHGTSRTVVIVYITPVSAGIPVKCSLRDPTFISIIDRFLLPVIRDITTWSPPSFSSSAC
jgi:hypothetical protein